MARLLRYQGEIPDEWKKRLDLLFGTDDWREELYRVSVAQPDLFGNTRESVERDAPIQKIEAFIHDRLAKTFEKAAKGLVLRNSRSSPLYLLCFAAANPKGATTAIKIAQDILKED